MSEEIDQKVVELKFDNAQFEEATKESMSTLDKLKDKLSFSNAGDGLEDLTKKVSSFSFSGMASSLDTIASKFTNLGIIGTTTLVNLTNKAVDAGTQIVKSLTIEPVGKGFDKYQSELTNIRTIEAATGKSTEEVEAELKRLTWFTDQTSYNYSDMADSVSKFVNNNVDLHDAVTSMEGIADWAAISGVNAEKASSAFYNLSQTMGAGFVDYQNFRQGATNLNMSTEAFKNQVIQTALAMGTIKKVGTDSYDTLTKAMKAPVSMNTLFTDEMTKTKWFTKDVLVEVLRQYAQYADFVKDATTATGKSAEDVMDILENKGTDRYNQLLKSMSDATGKSVEDLTKALDSQSMQLSKTAFSAGQEAKSLKDVMNAMKDAISTQWMESFEYVIGDLDEAKSFWTNIYEVMYDVFGVSGEIRNELLAGWKQLNGRNDFLMALQNIFNSLDSIVGPIKEAFEDIFPPLTAKRLKDITGAIANFTSKLILTKDAQDHLKAAFEGVFSIAKVGVTIIKGAISILGSFLSALSPIGDVLLELLGILGLAIAKFNTWLDQNEIIKGFFKFIADGISWVSEQVASFFEMLSKSKTFNDGFEKFSKSFSKFKSDMKSFKFPTFASFLDSIENINKKISSIKGINKVLTNMKTGLSGLKNSKLPSFDFKSMGIQNGGDLKSNFEGIKSFFTELPEVFKNFGTKSNLSFGTVTKAFSFAGSKMKTGITSLLNYFQSSQITWDKVFSTIKQLLGMGLLASTIKMLTKFGKVINGVENILNGAASVEKAYAKKLKADAFKEIADGIKEIAISVGILSASLIFLGNVPSDKLKQGLITLGIVLTMLGAFMVIMNKIQHKSTEIVPPIQSFKDSVLGVIKGFLQGLGKAAKIAAIGLEMVSFSVSLAILVGVVKLIDNLNLKNTANTLGIFLTMFGAMVAAIAIFGMTLKGAGGGLAGAAMAMTSFAFAMLMFVGILKLYDSLKLNNIVQTLLKMTSVVGILILGIGMIGQAVKGSGTGLLGASLALISFVLALKMMVNVLSDYDKLNLKNMGEDIAAISVMMISLGAAVALMGLGVKGSFTGLLSASVVLATLAKVIGKLAPIILEFANLNWNQIKKGLTVFSIVLASLVGAIVFTSKMGNCAVLTGVAASIIAITIALSAFTLLPANKLMSAAGMLVGVMASIALVSKYAAQANKNGKSEMIGIAITVVAVAAALAALTEFDSKKILISALAIVSVMAAIAVVAKSAGKVSKNAMGTILAIAGGFTAIVIALAVAARIAGHNINNIYALGEMASLIGITIAGMVKILSGLKFNKSPLKPLLTIAASLISLIVALGFAAKLAGNNYKSIYAIGSMVALMGTVIIGLIAISGISATANAAIPTIITIAASLAGLMLALGLAAKLASGTDSKSIYAIGQMVSLMGTVMAGILIASDFAAPANLAIPAILVATASLAGLMFALAYAAKLASGTDPKTIYAIGQMVSLMGTVMAGILLVSTFAAPANLAIPAILVVAGSLAGIMIAMAYAANLAGNNTDNIVALTAAMKQMTITFGVLALLGPLSEAALIGAAALDGVLLILGAGGAGVFWLLGKMSGMSDGVIKGINLLDLMATGLGKVFGDFVGAFSTGIADSLPKLGLDLSMFMTSLQTFITGAKQIDDGVSSGMKNLAIAIMSLTAAEVINGLTSWTAIFTGKSSLQAFGDDLAKFAPSLNSFASQTSGIKAEQFQEVSQGMLYLFDAISKIPNNGGFVGVLMGDNDISYLSKNLGDFGHSVKVFGDWAALTQIDAIESICQPMVDLWNALSKIPNNGGWIGAIMGENDISYLSKNLGSFGASLKSFSDNVNDSSIATNITSIVPAMTELFSALSKIPNSGGWIDKLFGSNSMTECSWGLPGFGKDIASFASTVSTVNAEQMAVVVKAIDELVAVFENASTIKSGSIDGFRDCIKTLGSMGVDSLTTSFTDAAAYKKINNAVDSMLDTAKNALVTYDITTSAVGKGKLFALSFARGITNNLNAVSDAASIIGKKSVIALGKSIGDPPDVAQDTLRKGELFTHSYAQGIKNRTSIAEAQEAAKEVGTKSTDGLAAGIKAGVSQLYGKNFDFSYQNALPNLLGVDELSKAGDDAKNTIADTTSSVGSSASAAADEFKTINDDFWTSFLNFNNTQFATLQLQGQSLTDFEKSILDKTKSIVDDYKNNAAQDAEDIAKDNLFSAIQEQEKTNPETLTKNLQDQIAQLNTYNATMASLGARIKDTNLKEALSNMSVDSLSQLQALNSMTDAQLTQYQQLFEQKYVAGFQEVHSKAQTQLSDLYGGAPIDIDKFSTNFDGTTGSIEKALGASIQNGQIGQYLTQGIFTGMQDPSILSTGSQNVATSVTTGIRDSFGIASPSTVMADQVGTWLTLGIKQGMLTSQNSLNNAAIIMISQLADLLRAQRNKFVYIGEMIDAGMIEGINSNRSGVISAAVQTATDSYEASKKALDVGSPSKLFRELGMYIDMGFANGIRDYSNLSDDQSEKMGNSAIKTMQDTISAMGKKISGEDIINTDPVIRPTLDMSSLNASADELNSLFNDKQIAIQQTAEDSQNDLQTQMQNAFTAALSASDLDKRQVTFTQNNYSPKSLDRLEIYRQTKNEFALAKEALE